MPAAPTLAASAAQPTTDGNATIQTPGGTTVIATDPKTGVVTINNNGHITRIDPRAIAAQAQGAAASAFSAATPPMPPMPPVDTGIPDSVVKLVVIILCILAVTIIGLPISRAMGRRMDRKAEPTDPEVVRRLDRIEQAIETMAVEVERVSEAQRYSAKLLTERLPEGLALRGAPVGAPGGERAS
jgi:hypothetical protein